MPDFLETVELQFGSRDLYKVLGVVRDAEEAELRRAYRRLSLRVHPDRANPEDVESATEKFQVGFGSTTLLLRSSEACNARPWERYTQC